MAEYRDELYDLLGGENKKNVNIHHVKNTSSKVTKPGALSKEIKSTGKLSNGKIAIIAVALLGSIVALSSYNRDVQNAEKAYGAIDAISDYRSQLDQAQKKSFDSIVQNDEKTTTYSAWDRFVLKDTRDVKIETIEKEITHNISNTYIQDNKAITEIAKATNFEVPTNLKNNQISSWIIKEIASDNNLKENFHSLLLATTMYREGFVNHVYNDVGYASVGPGQTVGVQTPKSVKERFSSIGMDEKRVNFFTGLSGKKLDSVKLPDNYKDFTISGKEGSILALLHAEKEFIPSVKRSIGEKGYNLILPQQQVALVGLAYQKGSIGNTTSEAVKKHIDFRQKNQGATTEKVIEHWAQTVSPTYSMSYTITDKQGNKKKIIDSKAILLATMISDDIDGLQKILSNTMTPREAKKYNIKLQEINSRLGNETNENLFSVDNKGNVSFYDPMAKLKEQANNGEISISVNKGETPVEQKKTGRIRLLK